MHAGPCWVICDGAGRGVVRHAVCGAGAQEAPGLLQTIEDFMWFKLALVRPSRPEAAAPAGYFSSAGARVARPSLLLLPPRQTPVLYCCCALYQPFKHCGGEQKGRCASTALLQGMHACMHACDGPVHAST
jgi:hypothetical protein